MLTSFREDTISLIDYGKSVFCCLFDKKKKKNDLVSSYICSTGKEVSKSWYDDKRKRESEHASLSLSRGSFLDVVNGILLTHIADCWKFPSKSNHN